MSTSNPYSAKRSRIRSETDNNADEIASFSDGFLHSVFANEKYGNYRRTPCTAAGIYGDRDGSHRERQRGNRRTQLLSHGISNLND